MNNPKDTAVASASAEEAVDLQALGLSEVAYLREAEIDGVFGFSIHAANGQTIGFAPGRQTAIAAVMTNDMELASLH